MDIQDPPELGPALLRWIQSFDFASSVRSWSDLQDSQILWRILVDVEPGFFSGDLPEESEALDNWIPRWQNLKHVNRLVMSFIRDECGKLLELSKKMTPDLKAIAIEASPKHSQALTKAVLLAALYSPKSNQRMIGVLDRLGTKPAVAIAQCITQMEQADQKLVEAAAAHGTDTESDVERVGSPERPPAYSRRRRSQNGSISGRRDPQLEHEEQLIKAYARIKHLEEQGADMVDQLQESRREVKGLEKDVQDLNYQLEHGTGVGVDDEALESLRQRSLQDKDNIAQLETELADARAAVEIQGNKLDRLQRESEAYHKLQDESQMLRTERDDLRQKAKANENLKKKIQTLQDSDKSNETLRQDLASVQQELQALRPFRQKVATLQKANEENQKLIQNGEQEIFDQKTTRRRLDHEMRLLQRQAESAKERHRHDQELIRELEEKSRAVETSGSTDETVKADSLDDEFASRDRAYAELKKRSTELEAEIERLREAQAEDKAEARDEGPDQSAYDLLRERCDKLEKQYLDVYQENMGLASASKDAEAGAQESQPFVQLRDMLKEETEQRATAEKKLFDIESELADSKLKLQSLDARYSAVGKDKDEAIKELQHSASYENEILHTENTRLLSHLRTFESDLEEHRSLLRHALLDKDALSRIDKDARFEGELKLMMEHLRAVVDNPDRTNDVALRLTQRLEESRNQATTMEAQAADERKIAEEKLSDFRHRLKKAEEGAKSSKLPDQETMQRELDLMTGAWYDITKRMQSDSVTVQRRADAPRSLLNRQRKLLNTTIVAKK